jgi:hypothetical protein
LGTAWLVGALLMSLLVHRLEQTPLRLGFVNFGGLALWHALGCLAAGGYGGDLVFGQPLRSGTLAALRMLPQGSTHLLTRKARFSLLILAVPWVAGIPLYLAAVLLNLTTAAEAGRALLLTGWSGLALLTLTILGTSDEPAHPLDPMEKQLRTVENTCRGLLVIGAGWLVLMLAFGGWNHANRWACYGLRLPIWLPGSLLSVVLALNAVSHAQELWLGELSTSRRAATTAAASLTFCYFLALGNYWHLLPTWHRALTLLVPLLFTFLNLWPLRHHLRSNGITRTSVTTSTRKEDPWTERELEWLQARWNNPLLLRDLRASLRAQSLLRKLRNSLIGQPLIVALFYFLVKWFGAAILTGTASWLFMPLFNGGGSASTFWAKEQKSGALPLLLLTPLSSREILTGRLIASVLIALPTLALPLGLLIVAVGWLATTRFWAAGPMALSVLPILLSTWVSSACSGATSGQKMCHFQSNPRFWLAQVGAVLLIPFGAIGILKAVRLGPLPCWGLALLIGSLHLGLAVFALREQVRKLESYRHSDIDPGAI